MKKNLNALPDHYVKAHKKLVEDDKTALDLSNFIYEALREKLISIDNEILVKVKKEEK